MGSTKMKQKKDEQEEKQDDVVDVFGSWLVRPVRFDTSVDDGEGLSSVVHGR